MHRCTDAQMHLLGSSLFSVSITCFARTNVCGVVCVLDCCVQCTLTLNGSLLCFDLLRKTTGTYKKNFLNRRERERKGEWKRLGKSGGERNVVTHCFACAGAALAIYENMSRGLSVSGRLDFFLIFFPYPFFSCEQKS